MNREAFEQLLDAAAMGRIDRRGFFGILAAGGASALAASSAAKSALIAGDNQRALRNALRKSYDYIVVGGGSAGCVVAARLAENHAASVLLIEAGGDDAGVRSLIDPKIWFTNIGGDHDWKMLYAPAAKLDNREVLISRGKVLGGSGSINAMLWVRGHPNDYDTWAERGAEGWDYRSVLPVFKRIEDWQDGETPLRGAGGPIHIEVPTNPHPISAALLEASRTLGYPVRKDVNGPDFGGASIANLNVRDGARASTSRAYLRPLLAQPNLTVLTGSPVLRLALDHAGNCTSVVHLVDGRPVETHVGKEVVMSAGSIATPKLLMLSGIGPADALRTLGIAPRHDLAEVGRNLKDHPLMMGVNFAYKGTPGPLCDNGGGAQLIAASGPDATIPDLMIVTIQVPYVSAELTKTYGVLKEGFAVTPGLMRVESKGSLTLRSADPMATPIIDPRLLSTEKDFRALMNGVEICQDLGRQPAYAALGRPATPDRKLDKSELAAFVRAGCATFYHPVGTCRMGTDIGAVVDSATLKLRGAHNIRVIDASVMPEIPTCNTHAATIMIAERGADMIKAA